jgi:hypothetical protein
MEAEILNKIVSRAPRFAEFLTNRGLALTLRGRAASPEPFVATGGLSRAEKMFDSQ